ncbi:hypothetical protein PsorP6_001606 [Peronosclerospora sorghi]|uniref:Uncharacterized protein n=1 Tax=Peronosclerospora sorghi TaxID=230839 RepID=A0ACC0WSZ4_9STRA|nr:hypothetical protein PsorP6_001606 [Peronosclerospora sorghi]
MAVRLPHPHASTHGESTQDYLINWNAGPLGVVLRPDLGVDMPPVVAQLLPQPSLLQLAGVREGDILISVNGKKTTRLGYEKVVRLLFKERLPMVLHFRSPLGGSSVSSGALADDAALSRARAHTSNVAYDHPPSPRTRGRSHVERHANAIPFESDKAVHKAKKPVSKSQREKSEAKVEAEQRRLRKQYSVVWERGSLGISFRAYNSKVNVPCVDYISATRGQGRGMDRVCVNDVLIAINGEKTKTLGVEKVLRWLHVVEKPVVLRFHASSNRVQNSAGPLLPQLLEDEETLTGPRIPKSQPEVEPVPRPPRRNNSLEYPGPQQRLVRRYSDDRELEQQPWTEKQHHSGGRFVIRDFEPPHQLEPSSIGIKDRRPSNSAHNRGRTHSNDDGKGAHSRAEAKKMLSPQFSMKIDAGVNRRQQHEDVARARQPQQVQILPLKIHTNTGMRDDGLRQQFAVSESKVAPQSFPVVAERPRLASNDSQMSNSSQMSFDDAVDVVTRTTGKPVNECEFGGVPLLDIREGTVQSKLMLIYAKACLAKGEKKLENEPMAKSFQSLSTPGNPLGRKTHSKFLSYTILQDDTVASSRVSSEHNDISKKTMAMQEEELKLNDLVKSDESKNAGGLDSTLDESFVKMQKDISVKPPPAATPLQLSDPTSSSSNNASSGLSAPAAIAPTDDFISLKDFVIKDGSLTKRDAVTSPNSAAIPVQPTDCVETNDTEEDQNKIENMVIGDKKHEICGEAMSEMTEELSSANTTEPASGDSCEVEETKDEQLESVKKASVIKKEQTDTRTPEPKHFFEDKDRDARNDDAVHDDHGNGSMDSTNERDMAAGVATFDDLLDLPLHDCKPRDEESEAFADDNNQDNHEEENEKTVTDEKKKCMLTPLLEKKKNDETDKLEDDETHEKQKEFDKEHEEEVESGALSNPLVNELFHDVPDVREVIKDKSALLVLVKRSMIDEIQEILQSLQMEQQFERHSTTAVGSIASPLSSSQHSQDSNGQQCDRCGATGELAELNVAGKEHELFCQECWEMFFFSEERQSPVRRTSKTLDPSEVGRLTADEDALDEALKYSFHDSSVSPEDNRHPWRYIQSSRSPIRDSNASSITDQADEVWL